MYRSALLAIAAWLFSLVLQAQEAVVPLQQHSPRLKWQQISTPRFRIVFPREIAGDAMRMANTFEHLYQPVSASLGKHPHRIDVLLQNQTSISNGYATLLPRHVGFFTMPPQDYNSQGPLDWLDQLAVHEFRHVVQFDKSKTGMGKLAWILTGNNGLAALAGLAVPDWFWEGDAVTTETLFSHAGRGRVPAFTMLYRSWLLERGAHSYHKAMMGSFKDPVPNHYVLGYLYTSYLKRHYGANVWDSITQRAFGNALLPLVFTGSIRKYTGAYVRPQYKAMNRELDSLWRRQLMLADTVLVNPLPLKQKKVYTDYLYPAELPDGRVLALKKGLADIDQLVAIHPDGLEEKIFVPGFIPDHGMLSVAGHYVAWSEYAFHPRWQMENYQVIKLLNVATKELRTLSRRSRLSAPALSPDASCVAAVEVNTAHQCALVVLSASSGQELRRYRAPEGDFISMPRYTANGDIVALLFRRGAGRNISLLDTATGQWKVLMPFTHHNIGHPVLHGEFVYYNASYDGIDNVYALHLASGRQWRVSSRPYGSFNPSVSPNGSRLWLNDFSNSGFRPVYIPAADTALWRPLNQLPERDVAYYQPLLGQEGDASLLEHVPDSTYTSRPYRQASELFNIYSWSPFIDPQDPRQLELAIYSRNLLNTTSATLGYQFNAAEQTGALFGDFTFQTFFPMLDVSFRTGRRQGIEAVNGELNAFSWMETAAIAGLRLPLNLTNSKYARRLSIGTFFSYRSISQIENSQFNRPEGQLGAMQYSAVYSSLLKRNPRDLLSRFGFVSRISYQHTPFGGDFQSAMLAGDVQVYLPGLAPHNVVTLRMGAQAENAQNYRFTSPLLFTRGYAYRAHNRWHGFSGSYRMPLWYPDFELGPLLYLKRLKSQLFADVAVGYDSNDTRQYRALGIDLSADLHFFRLPYLQFDVGVRYLYLPEQRSGSFQLVLGQIGF